MRVALVEDDPMVAEPLAHYLETCGYAVVRYGDLARFLQDGLAVDVVLLDLSLWDGEWGSEAVARVRAAWRHVPVMVMTAEGGLGVKLGSFQAGADDYVVKPFHPEELAARIEAVSRRPWTGETVRVRWEPDARRVVMDGADAALTPLEYEIFSALARQAGRALSRVELLQTVLGGTYYGDPRVVDVHVGHIRKKLGTEARHLETVRNFGYRWNPVASQDGRP